MSIIQVGNAPCSWGTLEFGSTKADRITYETMLDELVASGYTGSELGDWGFMPTEPDALLAAFKARDLSMTGAFMGFPFRDATCHAAAETEALKIAGQIAGLARRLGQRVPPFAVLADDNGT
ncbi:MAG: xylose isomerase, partial [Caldilineaceae bacterium]|nr:xylose isomerase [Caldilineaceae bacterium]